VSFQERDPLTEGGLYRFPRIPERRADSLQYQIEKLSPGPRRKGLGILQKVCRSFDDDLVARMDWGAFHTPMSNLVQPAHTARTYMPSERRTPPFTIDKLPPGTRRQAQEISAKVNGRRNISADRPAPEKPQRTFCFSYPFTTLATHLANASRLAPTPSATRTVSPLIGGGSCRSQSH